MIYSAITLILAVIAGVIGTVYIFTDNPASTDMIQWACIFVLFSSTNLNRRREG